MHLYDHWLVTQHESPDLLPPGEKLRPIALIPLAWGQRALASAVRARIAAISGVGLSEGASQVARILADNRKLLTSIRSGLYRRDVRLVSFPEEVGDGEGSWEWIVFDPADMTKTIPTWQGAAEGVIPVETSITVFDRYAVSSVYQIVD